MESLDALGEAVLRVEGLVGEAAFEPDASRSDWGQMKVRLQQLTDAVNELLTRLDPALVEARDQGPEMVASVGARVALTLGDAAAVLCAAGERAQPASWLARAVEVCPDDGLRGALRAAREEPLVWAALGRGRFFAKKGREDLARRSFHEAKGRASAPALEGLARLALDAPTPVTSPPSLFRINGCGASLYGRRDEGPDGSYVATYCVCFLWIPVVPLSAYRVKQVEPGHYLFSAKERLGPVARAWQALVGAAVLVGLGGVAVSGFLNSPTRKAHDAMREAAQIEQAGDRARAIDRYRSVIDTYGDKADVSGAAEGLVRLSVASVAEPCSPSSVDGIGRVVSGFADLPASIRGGQPEALLMKKLFAWSEQIGHASAPAARASLVVLDMAGEVASGPKERATVDARRTPLRKEIAAQIEKSRPVDALAYYARSLDDAGALASAEALADAIAASPSLLDDAAPNLLAVASAEERAGKAAQATKLRERLRAAGEERSRSAALIEGGDPKALAAALAAAPRDETLALGSALLARRRGDSAACLAAFAPFAGPGWLSPQGQLLLAGCHADAGQLARAEEVLSALVDERKAAFLEAQRAYSQAGNDLEERLRARAQKGDLPKEVLDKLTSASEAEQPEIFRAWVIEQAQQDSTLKQKKENVERLGEVVGASLELGSIRLQLAAEARGAERQRLLASAEQAFVSIRSEAEGEASFHLGLGQVYHRLGKAEQGDAELVALLARKVPELDLRVAHLYRELGLEEKARSIAAAVHQSQAPTAVREAAAALMALLARHIDERSLWLQRAGDHRSIKINKMEVEAQILLRDGKRAEAERAFARVASEYDQEAPHSPAAANNAALAHGNRFSVSGDVAHLRASVTRLEQAARLTPESALVAGNLAATLEHAGLVTVLDRWVQVRTLAPSSNQAQSLIGSLLKGPLRAEALRELSREPSFRKSLEVHKREQILAPTKNDAYDDTLRWLRWNRDFKALAELRGRLEALPPFDDGAEARRAWEAGEHDEAQKRHLQGSITEARERLSRAQQANHKPSLAAAWMLQAEALERQASLDLSAASIDAAVESYRRAVQLWPEGGYQIDLADALVSSGVLHAAEGCPPLLAAIKAEHRRYGFFLIAFRAARGDHGGEVLAALRAQPALAEAAKLQEAQGEALLGIDDWMLAVLLGDKALEARAAPAFGRPETADSIQLELRLAPGSRTHLYFAEILARGAVFP